MDPDIRLLKLRDNLRRKVVIEFKVPVGNVCDGI